MRRACILLLVTLVMSPLAAGSTFTLGPWIDHVSPYSDAGMITWTSPADGKVVISGDAWPTWHTESVWLEYVPEYLASLGLNPGNGVQGVLQSGTTPLLGGSVQVGYVSQGSPAAFGTSAWIPCSASVPWCGYTYRGPLQPIDVQKGDVIAALIENYYCCGEDIAGLDLNVRLVGDLQQQGTAGDLANPQFLTGTFTGLSGSLKPSSSHSSDAYEFYWSGGEFSGNATTNSIFGNSSVAGGFSDGLEMDLYSSPTGPAIGSWTVLDGSTASDSFYYGPLSAGNYVLQLIDKNSLDDPPYSIQFSHSIDPPNVPEPRSFLLVGACLLGLGGTIQRKFRRAGAARPEGSTPPQRRY